MVIQRYIHNPLLVDGLKFDLRIYVVIAGTYPLSAFICNEGLARFCTVNIMVLWKNRKNMSHLHVKISNSFSCT